MLCQGAAMSKLTDFASFLVYELLLAGFFSQRRKLTATLKVHEHALIHMHVSSCLVLFLPIRKTCNILLSTLNCIPTEKRQNKSNLTGKGKREEETGTETSVRSPHMYDLPCPHNKAKQSPIS